MARESFEMREVYEIRQRTDYYNISELSIVLFM